MRNFTLSALIAALLFTVPFAASATTVAEQPQASAVVQVTKVNLNTADAETLQRELAGIGLAKAQAIVAHRDTSGTFASIDELLEVKGIGKSLLDKNRDRLTVE